MIQFANEEIRNFVAFISLPDIPSVDLYVVPGFDSIETPDGRMGFACYIEHEYRIVVPEGLNDIDKGLILSSIAHEYYHHIEHCFDAEHNEDKAEEFANKMMELWEIKNKYSEIEIP